MAQIAVIGAGAVITPRTHIPPHSLVLGVPAKVVKTLPPESASEAVALAGKYVRLKDNYLRDALRLP